LTLAIAILMKDLEKAKTRLESVLGSDMRTTLARNLFEHTLRFFRQFYADNKLVVVTPSSVIADMARQHDSTALYQDGGDINEAAQIAIRWALSLEAEHLLIIHADIAVLQIAEIDQMIKAASEAAVVIAASHDGGSNALLLSPPDVIRPHFGRHSAAAHIAAAQAAQVNYTTLHLPHLRHDIDKPQDLSALIRKKEKQPEHSSKTAVQFSDKKYSDNKKREPFVKPSNRIPLGDYDSDTLQPESAPNQYTRCL